MTTKITAEYKLPSTGLGSCRKVTLIRYGDLNASPKVYIQTGLHADEPPGVVVMHHLIELLDAADRAGEITGQILLVPVANPIGISQWGFDHLQGRYDLMTGINFNRRHLDVVPQVAKKIEGELTDSAERNTAIIRETTAQVLKESQPQGEVEYLKWLLLRISHDADIVLDLHCDSDALLHVYMPTCHWPHSADLSAQLGAVVTLLANDSGGNPYDEACSAIWWKLADKFPGYPICPSCLAASVELRGQSDVSHTHGQKDALNIYRFLQRRGLLAGKTSTLPDLLNSATPLSGVEYLTVSVSGIIVYAKKPGEQIEKGEVVAEIINPLQNKDQDRVTAVRSRVDGIMFARRLDRYARPGRIIAKIAAKAPLEGKGGDLLPI